MLYLHVINTHDDSFPTKSMFIENEDSYRIGQLISENEIDNLVIINSLEINKNKRTMKILHIFLNGNEDSSEVLKINKKNN